MVLPNVVMFPDRPPMRFFKLLVPLVLLHVLFAVGAQAQSARKHDEDMARDLNNIAAQYYNDGKYQKALSLYAKVLALNPRPAVFYNNRATAREKVDDLAGALADYDTALRIDPSPAVFYSNRAALLLRRKEVDHALADYDRAVKREPATGFFRQERGKARLAAGNRNGALTDFKAAVRLDPKLTFSKAEVEALSDDIDAKPQPAPPTKRVGKTRRIALIVGNGAYRSIGGLSNPRHDAEKMAQTLRAAGFASVETLFDGTRQQMIESLDRFEAEASRSDWAVVYYAGHGVEAAGVNYLLPVDLVLKDNIELQAKAISLDRVLSALQRAAKLRLVILDACRNDPFAGEIARSVRTRAVVGGLAPPSNISSGGLAVVYSAKGGQLAQDGPPGGNSPFALSLATRIDEPGVELGRLLRLVRDDVVQATKNVQEPYLYGSLPSTDLFIHPM